MNSKCKILLLVLFLLIPSLSEGGEDLMIEKAMKAKKYLFDRNYEEGMRLFKEIGKEFPDSPTGAFGEMATWQVRMFENYDFRFRAEYEEAEARYNKIAMRILKRGNVSDWDLFICSAADGMRGFFKTREDKWWGALQNGMHSHRLLKQLVWRNPDFIDVYLGLGLYDYWRSRMTKQLKVLPIFSDKRAEGIEQIKRVVREGKYASDLAKGNLGMVYYEENRYQDAIDVLGEMVREYPQNIVIRMLLGRSYLGAKKFQDALKQFEAIESIDPAITKAVYYKATAYRQMKDGSKKAVEYYAAYLGTNPEPEWAAAAHYFIGVIAEGEKDIDRALKEYKKAFEISNKMKGAEAAIKRLEKLSNKRN